MIKTNFSNFKQAYSEKCALLLRSIFIPFAYLTFPNILMTILSIIKSTQNIDNRYFDAMLSMSQILVGLFPIVISITIASVYSKRYVIASVLSIYSWIIFVAFQTLFINISTDKNSWKVLFYSNINKNYFSNFLNINNFYSIGNGVITGLVIGFGISFILNKFNNHKIFSWLNYNRFFLFISPFILFIFALIHLLIHGAIVKLLSVAINPNNLYQNAYLYSLFERLFLPFGYSSSISTHVSSLAQNNTNFLYVNTHDFITSIFLVPAAGITFIWLVGDRINKRFTFTIVIATMIGSFTVGSQNVILLMILFASPLFYGLLFIIIMPIIQLILASLHIGFASEFYGLTSYILYGLKSDVLHQTHNWSIIIFGILLTPGLMFSYKYWAKKFKVSLPGLHLNVMEHALKMQSK